MLTHSINGLVPSALVLCVCVECIICYDLFICFFFFFKQKTAYEILTCDWSSDVCSSDLPQREMGSIKSGALPQREIGSIKSGGAAAARIGKCKKRRRCRKEHRAL